MRDLQDTDLKAFHKFLWEHHLDRYGLAYQAADLFESGKLNSTTRAHDAFVADLIAALEPLGGAESIESVLDVGCSVGHVLWNLEQNELSAATSLVGIDIDREAIEQGSAYLAKTESRIRLVQGDLESLDAALGPERFDFTYAAGSLSYLEEEDATRAVHAVLERTDRLAAFIGLANKSSRNSELDQSAFRADWGNMWTHDFERMIATAPWRVVSVRWEPPTDADRQGLYFVFAVPEEAAGVSKSPPESS